MIKRFRHDRIDLVRVDRSFLQGSRGEIVPAEGCLYYDRDLEADPREKLEVIAHEYAHLILHHKQFAAAGTDLIRGSVFLQGGAAGMTRYSPRSQAEAEASAFAAELICPADEVFERWRAQPSLSSRDLAELFQATESLIGIQLAEGLYEHVTGAEMRAVTDKEDTTPEQENAAIEIGRPVLVDAGPGTGKTKTLVRRIVHLITERNVDPQRILVLTFSNEAAAELNERIERRLGADVARSILAVTFHGFGMRLLHVAGHHVGRDVDFSVVDETAQQELVSEVLGQVDCEALLDIKNPEKTASEVTQQIYYLKDRLIGPSELRQAIESWNPEPGERRAFKRAVALLGLFAEYERIKNEKGIVDFPDMVLLPYTVLSVNEDLRDQLRNDFPWVLVDEYQDVSRATALLLQQICGTDNPPWVVGDARQSIYRFRGAEPENVRRFREDFPGARLFHLSANYRSAPEIIAVANHLAALLGDPNHTGAIPERWRPGGVVQALANPAVVLATANNDAAERDGVVARVQQWLSVEIPPEEIAVLARRNIDVRNIAIALKERSIRSVTSGILTAEGAGGDLAAVLTTVDHNASLARVVYALWRKQAPAPVLNGAVSQLLAVDFAQTEEPTWTGASDERDMAAAAWHLIRDLRGSLHSGDGWVVLCRFLFFASSYARDLLQHHHDVESAVQLEEILSALSLAATYRFTHSHIRPRRSRLGLAERLRDLVTDAAPGIAPPRPRTGAVQVMTCHAAKGLEFPCVAVAGQSLADIPKQPPCLPPSLRPSLDSDALQAESLLFVGASRAKSALVVSYAASASGTRRSKPRRLPRLLERWRDSGAVPVCQWETQVAAKEEITVGRIWGGEVPTQISLYSLSADTCRVRTYLEEQLGARFRGRLPPLYPHFISRVRRMLRRVVVHVFEVGRRASDIEVAQIVDEEWPIDDHADHPHLALYRPRAQRWTRALAEVYRPDSHGVGQPNDHQLVWEDVGGVSRALNLQLIGHFRDANGDRVAIAVQPNAPDDDATHILWSDLKDYHRLSFVLLHEQRGNIRPLVFCGEEAQLRAFRWRNRKPEEAVRDEAERARTAFEGLVQGRFDGTVTDWTCDRCRCRTICPWWIGASSGDD